MRRLADRRNFGLDSDNAELLALSGPRNPYQAGTNAMLLGAPLLMAHDNDYGW